MNLRKKKDPLRNTICLLIKNYYLNITVSKCEDCEFKEEIENMLCDYDLITNTIKAIKGDENYFDYLLSIKHLYKYMVILPYTILYI